MAGRGFMDECSYARLRRWEKLNGQWVDHFNQDVSVEVIFTGGRVMLLCRVYNSSQSFQCPIDDANITRSSNDVFEILTSQGMALQLYFKTIKDADIFQRSLRRLQFRDERPPPPPMMSPDQRQFDGGGPFQPYRQQPPGDQLYGYDRQGSQGQQRYHQQQYGGQDQRWDQRHPMTGPGPGARDHNQYNEQPVYQNLPMGGAQHGRDQYGGGGVQRGGGVTHHGRGGAPFHGGGQFEDQNRHQFVGGGDPYGRGRAPYGGGGGGGGGEAQHGRNQGQYDDRGHMYNQQPGMNQGWGGAMQPGTQQGYQQGGPPGRGIQDVPHRPKEAWSDRQNANTQPFNINTASTELELAINNCDLGRAYDVIDQLEKLDKSQRAFNVQLKHFGEIQSHEEEPVKEEEKNEFRLKVAIERQCAPNENAIDIIIKAKEEDTIEELVNLFETQYNIPGEVQRWIIKQQLASDKSKWGLKDFQVTKDGGIEQGVYLFVIQGMKERIKEEFLNKRQQQVEDDQRQQQERAQEENYRKQTQIANASNTPDQFGSVMPYNNNMPQQQQQQYGQPFDAPNQGGYMNRGPPPNQAPPQNMGPGFYQDQQPMRAAEQPVLRAQPQQRYDQQQQRQLEYGYNVGDPGPLRDEYRRPRDEYRPPREEYRPQPMDRYIPDPGPPRDEYQQKLPVHQAEMRPPPAIMQQNDPPRGAAGGIQVFPTMPQQKTQVNVQPPPVAPKSIAIGQPEKPRGWNCPVCTFLNEPYRPGCKMCSSAPPEGYEPPADHVPSAEEMKFMQ